jgi:Flp pilus assembly protein TadD
VTGRSEGTVGNTRLNLAEELIDLGRYDDAARIIDAVLVADPDSAGALCARARLRSRVGDYAGMRAAASAAAAQRPNWEYPHRLISIATRMLDEPRVALAAAEAAVAVAPQDPVTHQVHAQALVANGRYVEAYRVAERARELTPTDPESFHVLAEVFQAAGDLTAARDMYLAELRLAPNSVSPLGGLAYLRWIAGRDAVAARAYRDVLVAAPTDGYYRRALHTAITFMQFRWVAVGVAGVAALAIMNRAGVTRLMRLGVGVAVVVGVLVGVWWAHRGLRSLLREHLRRSVRTYGPLAPLPAAGAVGLGVVLYVTASGPPHGWVATTVKVLLFLVALIPSCLLVSEVAGAAARRHRRGVLRRAIRADAAGRAVRGAGDGPS